jgi:hypothetical protein
MALPAEAEIRVRLGCSLMARRFDVLSSMISRHIQPGTNLSHRLEQAWLKTLRYSGNGAFIEVERRQALLVDSLSPEEFVSLAEEHADLASHVSPTKLYQIVQTQIDLARVLKKMDRAPLGQELLVAAARQSAHCKFLGEREGLRLARNQVRMYVRQ